MRALILKDLHFVDIEREIRTELRTEMCLTVK